MKTINLISLELTNFRNIEHQKLVFDGNSKIIGENRIGKTNTLEAIVWLLTDKLLNGNTEISAIKPIDDTSKKVTVEAEFDVDGKKHTIKKVYGENWIKRRNTDELYLDGHFCEYHYDGIKQTTLKGFNNLFYTDFGIPVGSYDVEIVRLLTDPLYVGELGDSKDWTKLRTFIISLVGDVQPEEIYEAAPSLTPLKEELEAVSGRSDQLKKKLQMDIDSIKKDLIGYDSQIELLEKTDRPTDEEVNVAKHAINDLDEQITELKASTDNSKLDWYDKLINEKNAALNRMKTEALETVKNKPANAEISKLKAHESELHTELSSLMSKRTTNATNLKDIDNKIENCKLVREKLIHDIKAVDADLTKPIDVCPTCGQPLPQEKLIEAKMNLTKLRETIIANGQENKAKLSQLMVDLENETLDGMQIEKDLKALNDQLDAIAVKIQELQNNDVENNPFDTPEITKLESEIENLYKEKALIRADKEAAESNKRQRIYELTNEKSSFMKVMDDYVYYQRQMALLEEVKVKKSEAGKKLTATEQKMDLLKLYIKTQLDLLNKHVAVVFENIKFDLIRENINGGYDTICKPHIVNSDVLWKSGSKSEKVITGITIADKIKEKLDLPNLPFLFDEGGEISSQTFADRIKTKSQLICVQVQDNIDKPTVVRI